MKAEYIEKLPKWYNENKNYELILSDDIDSLASCMVLKQVKGWNIEYFYLFYAMGKTIRATENDTNMIGVDIALCNGKAFDNHVVKFNKDDEVNPLSINLNIVDNINRNPYFNKYCGSTLLQVWSLFNLPLPESEIGKMILLSIDSSQLGYYSAYPLPQQANKYYLCDVLGFEELYKLQERHKSYEFGKINNEFGLKNKIESYKGKLSTKIKLEEISKELGINIELPTERFFPYKEFDECEHSLSANRRSTTILTDVIDNPYSLALTGKDYVCYSLEKVG